MTAGLDLTVAQAADRVDHVARVHVPAQQLGPLQPPLLHPGGDDVPAHQRGAHGREGHRGPALLQGVGPAARRSCCSLLMGIGTLFGWKKTSPEALRRAFRAPLIAMGSRRAAPLRDRPQPSASPPSCGATPIYTGALGAVLRVFNAFTPVIGFSLCVFNAAVIVQEFVLLLRRARAPARARARPSVLWWLGGLPGLVHTLISPLAAVASPLRRVHRATSASCSCSWASRGSRGTWTARPRSTRARRYSAEELHAQLRGRAHGGRQQQAHGLRRRRRLQERQVRGASQPRQSSSTRSSRTRRRPRSPSGTGCATTCTSSSAPSTRATRTSRPSSCTSTRWCRGSGSDASS